MRSYDLINDLIAYVKQLLNEFILQVFLILEMESSIWTHPPLLQYPYLKLNATGNEHHSNTEENILGINWLRRSNTKNIYLFAVMTIYFLLIKRIEEKILYFRFPTNLGGSTHSLIYVSLLRRDGDEVRFDKWKN